MITIGVPESLAERLQDIPEAELSEFLQGIVEEYEARQDAVVLAAPLSAEDIAAVRQGLAEADAGLGTPWEDYLTERRAAREARKAQGETPA